MDFHDSDSEPNISEDDNDDTDYPGYVIKDEQNDDDFYLDGCGEGKDVDCHESDLEANITGDEGSSDAFKFEYQRALRSYSEMRWLEERLRWLQSNDNDDTDSFGYINENEGSDDDCGRGSKDVDFHEQGITFVVCDGRVEEPRDEEERIKINKGRRREEKRDKGRKITNTKNPKPMQAGHSGRATKELLKYINILDIHWCNKPSQGNPHASGNCHGSLVEILRGRGRLVQTDEEVVIHGAGKQLSD